MRPGARNRRFAQRIPRQPTSIHSRRLFIHRRPGSGVWRPDLDATSPPTWVGRVPPLPTRNPVEARRRGSAPERRGTIVRRRPRKGGHHLSKVGPVASSRCRRGTISRYSGSTARRETIIPTRETIVPGRMAIAPMRPGDGARGRGSPRTGAIPPWPGPVPASLGARDRAPAAVPTFPRLDPSIPIAEVGRGERPGTQPGRTGIDPERRLVDPRHLTIDPVRSGARHCHEFFLGRP